MTVSNVSNSAIYNVYANDKITKEFSDENVQKKDLLGESEDDGAIFVKNDSVSSKSSYEDAKVNKLTKEQIEKLDSMRQESLRNMVSQLLAQQAGGKISFGEKQESTLAKLQETMNNLDVNTADVETDAVFGIDAVATRIMDMAASLSGGDTSKISLLRDAVEQGFREAGMEFGSDLPDVCNKTYDEIMNRFDYWEENGTLDGYSYKGAANSEKTAE